MKVDKTENSTIDTKIKLSNERVNELLSRLIQGLHYWEIKIYLILKLRETFKLDNILIE